MLKVKLKFGSPEGGKAAVKEAAQKVEAETARKKNISRFWQKKKNKEIYRAAKAGEKVSAGGGAISASGAVTETITEKGKRVAREILFRNKSILFTHKEYAKCNRIIKTQRKSLCVSEG